MTGNLRTAAGRRGWRRRPVLSSRMFVDALSLISGTVAASLSATIALPQAIRAVRISTAGVSPATFQLACAVGIAWAAYGFTQELWLVFVGNVVLSMCSAVVLGAMRRDGAALWDVSRLLLPVAGLCLLVALLESTWLAWLAGSISVALRIPQMRMIRSADSIQGISVHTWIISAASMIAWIIYAALNDDYRLIVTNIINIALTASMILGVQARRSRESAPHETDDMTSPV
jgi:uncharacterized protein with PQ loop repeat